MGFLKIPSWNQQWIVGFFGIMHIKDIMVNYDRILGKAICDKYLAEMPLLLHHSQKCGELCYELAKKIIDLNPELRSELDPELMGFLGFTHNIGTIVSRDRHEFHTMYILTKKEGIPENIAIQTRHGQLVEDYQDPHYYPRGIDGILLTYVDLCVRPEGNVLPLSARLQEMETLMMKRESVFRNYTEEMVQRFKAAVPRYQRYDRIIQSLLQN